MFKRPKAQQRRRIRRSDDEDDDGDHKHRDNPDHETNIQHGWTDDSNSERFNRSRSTDHVQTNSNGNEPMNNVGRIDHEQQQDDNDDDEEEEDGNYDHDSKHAKIHPTTMNQVHRPSATSMKQSRFQSSQRYNKKRRIITITTSNSTKSNNNDNHTNKKYHVRMENLHHQNRHHPRDNDVPSEPHVSGHASASDPSSPVTNTTDNGMKSSHQPTDSSRDYSKETLQQLKAEQRRRQQPPQQQHHHQHDKDPLLSESPTIPKDTNETIPSTIPASTFDNNNNEERSRLSERQQGYTRQAPTRTTAASPIEILSGEEALELQEPFMERGNTDTWRFPSVRESHDEDFIELQRSTSSFPRQDTKDKYQIGTTSRQNPWEINDHDDDDDAEPWEATLIRRAGVTGFTPDPASLFHSYEKMNDKYPNDTISSTTATAPTTGTSPSSSNRSAAGKVQAQIQAAISQLEVIRQSQAQVERRLTEEVDQIQLELDRNLEDFHQTGKLLEYFQSLQQRIISWVGALRELQSRVVVSLQPTAWDLLGTIADWEGWIQRQDDAVAILQQYGHIYTILGRKPIASNFEPEGIPDTYDEFGRRLQSKVQKARERRFQKRQTIAITQHEVKDGHTFGSFHQVGISKNSYWSFSYGYHTTKEQTDLWERKLALEEAISLATADFDPYYCELPNLVRDFVEWYQSHPKEYQQCYASLSLSDLASVLIRLDLCFLDDPWNDDENEEYKVHKWQAVIHEASVVGVLDNDAVERIVEKAVVTTLQGLFKKMAINLSSSRQVKSIGSFVRIICDQLLGSESNTTRKLYGLLSSYVSQILNGISIPLLSSTRAMESESPSSPLETDMLEDAIHYTNVEQTDRIARILSNVLEYWGPLLHKESAFAESVLNFFAYEYIPLLSSLSSVAQQQNQDRDSLSIPRSTCFNSFQMLWQSLRKHDILNHPDHLVASMTIQAAAQAYGKY